MKTDAPQNNGAGLAVFLRRHPWLTAAVAFVLLLGALYILLEWRAEQRWQRYAAAARARGTKLHFTDFSRPEIPEAKNFFALPLLQMSFAKETRGSRFMLPPRPRPTDRAKLASFDERLPPLASNKEVDWKAWQQYFQSVGYIAETSDDPVRDVLRALEHYAPYFQQWNEWRTTRTQNQLPLDSAKASTLSGNLALAVPVFHLRMYAHMASGDSMAAYTDFQDAMQAPRALRDDPSGQSSVLRKGMFRSLVNAVGAGLREHSWADPELKKLEADLAAISLWDDFCLTMEGVRCDYNNDMEERMNTSVRGRIAWSRELLNDNASRMETLLEMLTRSLFRDNELRLNHHFDEMTARGGGPDHTFDPDRPTPSAPENITDSFEKDYYWLGGQSGGFSETEEQYIVLQILFDQARLGCALERFRLARGAFPKTLEELTPEFISTLPNDPYTRAAYHYRPVGKDSFLLYSVGKNRKDDGGQDAPDAPDSERPDLSWRFAPAPTAP